MTAVNNNALNECQQALGLSGAYAAVGDIPRLQQALSKGLDAGLTINQAKEAMIQVYAYAGFPRSLNALAALKALQEERLQKGIKDEVGAESGPIPTGDELLRLGTDNQTRLTGRKVTGPVFDFAPTIDQFLKTHLFGDIFAREGLDWQSRELATLGMLAAQDGLSSQLESHVRISRNIGLSDEQLQSLATALTASGAEDAASRLRSAVAATH